jgi:hypothetical protein
MRSIWLFTVALAKRWWASLGSAIFTIIGLYALITGKSNHWIVAVSIAVGIMLFLVASFGAWKEQYDARLVAERRLNDELSTKQKDTRLKIAAAMKQGANIYVSLKSASDDSEYTDLIKAAADWVSETYARLNEAELPTDAEAFFQIGYQTLSPEQLANFAHIPEWKRDQIARFLLYRQALDQIRSNRRL